MDREFTYQSIRNFMKRNFWKLWLGILVISLINGLMTTVFGKTITNSFISFSFGSNDTSMFGFEESIQVETINADIFVNVFQTTLGLLLNSGLLFAVLRSFRNNWFFQVSSIFKQLSISTFNTLLVCTLLSMITYFLALIPFFGMIFSMVLTYASYVLILIVHEENINPIRAFKSLYRMIKISRGSVFVVLMRYILLLVLGLFVSFAMISFGAFGILMSLICGITVFFRYYPRIYVAIAVCYAVVNREASDIRYSI